MTALQVIYQPHVVQADGACLTPDIALADLAVALPATPPLPVSIERWTTRVDTSEAAGRTLALPALVLVAASRGDLLVPGVVHADARQLDADPLLALQAGAKVVGRFAVRLLELSGVADRVHLSWEVDHTAVPSARREWPLPKMVARHACLRDALSGWTLPPGFALMFVVECEQMPARSAWHRVALHVPGMDAFQHEYLFSELPVGWSEASP